MTNTGRWDRLFELLAEERNWIDAVLAVDPGSQLGAAQSAAFDRFADWVNVYREEYGDLDGAAWAHARRLVVAEILRRRPGPRMVAVQGHQHGRQSNQDALAAWLTIMEDMRNVEREVRA